MARTSAKKAETEATTTLDSDVTKPSTVAPGDAPADTTDPTERAVSVPPAPGPEALEAGTVNAVVPAPKEETPKEDKKADRIETWTATRFGGKTVTVTRNLETGEVTVK